MVTSLLVGLVVGFVLAIPPGPLAIACISQALAGQARESVALALSASAMDIGYALLAAFASSALLGALRCLVTDNAWSLLAFQGGCIVVLVVLGLRYCWTTGGAGRPRQRERDRARGDAPPYPGGDPMALT